MKALVVEDEMVVARHLSRVLEEIGYTVPAMALTTEEALEIIDQHHPDIVLIDIVLKGEEDGIDLARRLRADYNVPFLFITSHADRQTVRRAKATRPSGYVMKPFKKDEVYAATEIALSNYADEKNAPQPFDEKQPDDGESEGLPPYHLKKVKAFIEEHLDENLTLSELAGVVNISKYYFSRLFKQSVGVSPYRYLMQQRIEEAKRLLSQTDWPIAQIALRTGFGSQSHLSKTFKKFTGISPSAYRSRS